MKIIGIITAWASEMFIEPAIKQGLKYCDELHVCVSAHSDNMLQFEDNTYKIAEKYKSDIILSTYDNRSSHAKTKADILNYSLQNSKYFEEGNWIWILDIDEFFKEKTFSTIKGIIENDICDMIQFGAYFFYIGTKHYLLSEHNRLFKIKSKTNRFFPTQNWPFATNYVKIPLGMYHYSMLLNPHMKMEFWKTEYDMVQNNKITWLDRIYRNYDLENEKYWIHKNKELTGNYGPWISDAFIPDKDGTLFKYNDKHPKLIEDTGITKIKDYRKYWEFE